MEAAFQNILTDIYHIVSKKALSNDADDQNPASGTIEVRLNCVSVTLSPNSRE